MEETRAVYKLRRFTSSTDRDFARALKVYSRFIPPSLKTNTNEIAYWLDNYAKHYEDRLLLYGFYVNQRLVGYSELAWFKEERILIVDYIVIDEQYRKNNVFFEFAEHLRHSIQSEDIDVDYLIAEVASMGELGQAFEYSRALIRLLKFLGLGLVKAPYFQPQLGFSNFESKIRASLMVSTFGLASLPAIGRETYRLFVQTIYYKHYLRWYSMYEGRASEYKTQLDDLYGQIEEELGEKKKIEINGYKDILQGPNSTTEGPKSAHFKLGYLSMLIVLATTGGLLALKHFLDISTISLIFI